MVKQCAMAKKNSKAVMKKNLKKDANESYARLSPHLRGEMWGLHRAGYSNREIAQMVVKTDGKHPSKDAVRDALALRVKMGPRWDGVVTSGATASCRMERHGGLSGERVRS